MNFLKMVISCCLLAVFTASCDFSSSGGGSSSTSESEEVFLQKSGMANVIGRNSDDSIRLSDGWTIIRDSNSFVFVQDEPNCGDFFEASFSSVINGDIVDYDIIIIDAANKSGVIVRIDVFKQDCVKSRDNCGCPELTVCGCQTGDSCSCL